MTNIRPWIIASCTAVLVLGVSSGASASAAAAQGGATHAAPRVARIRGFHQVKNVRLPRVAPQHLTPKETVGSSNWAGYAAVGDKNVALRYVSADFNVPSLNCANSPAGENGTIEGQWAGLDGYNTATVEQVGIAGYCDEGTATYYAWYEMYPDPAVMYEGQLSPGDSIQASVYYDASTAEYDIVLNDVTTGGSINVQETCPSGSSCKNASAEVISEVPGGGPANGYDLADFGMENFTNTGVTSRDGQHGSLSASKLWSSSEIVMEDPSGASMVQPSSLYGGLAFNSTWLTGA